MRKNAVIPPDPLKHFAKDGPWVKLAALAVDRSPAILKAMAVLATSLAILLACLMA